MKFAYIREANISHLRSKYFTAKLFHMAKPYFTRRRRISLKKAHIVLVDKCVLFSGGPSGTQNPQFAACSAFPKVLLGELLGEILLLQNSRGSSQFSSSKRKKQSIALLLSFCEETRKRCVEVGKNAKKCVKSASWC